MEKESLTSILRNRHFNQFAAILSITMSPKWRMAHPEVPSVRSTLDYRLAKLSRALRKDAAAIKKDFLSEWTKLFTQVTDIDSKLRYSVEDLDWFLQVLESDDASLIFSMLFAVATSRRDFFTAEQVADLTGEGASTWRYRAANDLIVGSFKAGKTWMFSSLALRAYGVEVGEVMAVEEENEF